MSFVLKNGTVFVGGQLRRADIFVFGGRIAAVGGSAYPSDAAIFDISGKYVFPGFADVHVHLREPGFSYKETISGGTRSAARGGYTCVCAMPNLNPIPDSPEHLRPQQEAIRAGAAIDVRPYGAISVGERGETLADMRALAPYVCAFSDDGRGVQSDGLMREAMRQAKSLGRIIAAHCEVNSLLHGGCIHDGDWARAHGYAGICSESEWRQVRRDLALARETGCAYHVCHVSTRESVELIREAKAEGVDVSCETAPHYLLLCDKDMREDGRFKMNPPLRSLRDREALLEGLCDGTIDIIATDHAPHTPEEKSRGLRGSPMGIAGLETAFATLYTGLVRKGVISLETLLDRLCTAPRRRFGLGGGEICEGASADLTVFDLDSEYTVRSADFVGAAKSTPFEGCTVRGRCLATLYRGKPVWQEGKSKIQEATEYE